jgi:hypothetical protein
VASGSVVYSVLWKRVNKATLCCYGRLRRPPHRQSLARGFAPLTPRRSKRHGTPQ